MNRSILATVMSGALLSNGSVIGRSGDVPPIVEAKPLAVDAKISTVTLYRGRAAVARTANVKLDQGVYDLQFTNLPEAIQPATLQARATGSVKVLGVDFAQEAAAGSATEKIAELDRKIEELQRGLKEIAEQREVIKAQEDFISSIAVKAAAEASKETGSEKLDLEAVRHQLAFVAEERTKLLTARHELDAKQRDLEKQLQVAQSNRQAMAGGSNVNRTAVVSVAALDAGQATVELTYLVANATWEPAYNIRASIDGSTALVEYDALLTQRTGEDWDNVTLLLSTAQPTMAANPPALQPWFVDILRPEEDRRKDASGRSLESARFRAAADEEKNAAPPAPMKPEDKAAELRAISADAEVAGAGGPSVTFQLPRAITVKTNVQKQQRTRIVSIDTQPKFIRVAVPMLTDAVYLRGDLTNSSAYQLLPGKASIFVGQDYVGPTMMSSVAPSGEFKVHFGIDQAVKTVRQLVSKKTENTGLLNGGRRTNYQYRLAIDNGAGKPIVVEMWDRYPVSRNSDIQVELIDLGAPLSTDAYYVSEEKPQGLLKWVINVPASASGKAAYVLTYGVRINRAKGVEMTPLPE